jgi:hypothetical protein
VTHSVTVDAQSLSAHTLPLLPVLPYHLPLHPVQPVRIQGDSQGLLRKRMKGSRKVQEAAESRGNCPVLEPSSTYQTVSLWEIAEVQSLVGGLYLEPASGLRWEDVGKDELAEGRALGQEHEKLRKALSGKTEFSPKVWTDFDIKDLRMAHFVKSGAHYFRPTATEASA